MLTLKLSGELIEIHSQLVGFAVGEEVFPGHFMSLVAGHAAEHAAQRGLDSGGDLVVRLAGGDAFDEGALLVAVGEFRLSLKLPLAANFAGRGRCSWNPARPRVAVPMICTGPE